METSLILIVAIGIFVAVLILFKPISGLVLIILYLSITAFPMVLPNLFGIFTHLHSFFYSYLRFYLDCGLPGFYYSGLKIHFGKLDWVPGQADFSFQALYF